MISAVLGLRGARWAWSSKARLSKIATQAQGRLPAAKFPIASRDKRMKKTSAALLGLLTVAGCSRIIHVWLEPGSTASHLVIRMSASYDRVEPLPLRNLQVVSWNCAKPSEDWRNVWELRLSEATNSTHPVPLPVSEITYGVSPGSEYVVWPAEPLQTGCYAVSVSGTVGRSGGMHFHVEPDGSLSHISGSADLTK